MNNRVFDIKEGHLVLKSKMLDGMFFLDEEPIFILRARDNKALSTIRVYQSIFAPTSEQWKVVQAVIDDFTNFRRRNPGKMAEPSEVY